MKDNLCPKKISDYDKFQALKRKPSYRADYWDFTFWCRENHIDETEYLDHPEAAKKAEELCKKYGISYLFNPSTEIPKHPEGAFFMDQKTIVEVIYPTDYRDLNEDELKKGIRPHYLPIPIFNNMEELIIKIDLRADKGHIIENIIEQLDYYHYFVIKNKSRMTSDRNVDKWKVWDAYNQTKSFKKTLQKLNHRSSIYAKVLDDFGLCAKNPLKIDISTVRKAYYRAIELVYEEKYDPEKHKPEKLPVKLRGTCDQCPEFSTCKDICPDVMEYVTQDEEYQRERPMPQNQLDILYSPRSHRKAPKPPIE